MLVLESEPLRERRCLGCLMGLDQVGSSALQRAGQTTSINVKEQIRTFVESPFKECESTDSSGTTACLLHFTVPPPLDAIVDDVQQKATASSSSNIEWSCIT
jgi:hypothetical protein